MNAGFPARKRLSCGNNVVKCKSVCVSVCVEEGMFFVETLEALIKPPRI